MKETSNTSLVRTPFVTGFIIGLVLIVIFLALLFFQGKLIPGTTQEVRPMEMPREVSPRIEQHVDSLNYKTEELDTLL